MAQRTPASPARRFKSLSATWAAADRFSTGNASAQWPASESLMACSTPAEALAAGVLALIWALAVKGIRKIHTRRTDLNIRKGGTPLNVPPSLIQFAALNNRTSGRTGYSFPLA